MSPEFLVFWIGLDISCSRLGLGYRVGTHTYPELDCYFRRKLTLVLAFKFVAAGSLPGSNIHPFMLNYLLNGHIGFANGKRIVDQCAPFDHMSVYGTACDPILQTSTWTE